MTPFIEWGDRHSVGVKRLDQQHQKLFDLINLLYLAIQEKRENNILSQILEELIRYTVYHFQDEEGLMKELGYSEYHPHKELHDSLVREVNRFRDEYSSGNKSMAKELFEFLKKWINQHILVHDLKYKDYFKSKGLS